MRSARFVYVVVLACAAALQQGACSDNASGVASGAEIPVGGATGAGGSDIALDASPWPGMGGTGGKSAGGMGGKGTAGNGAGGTCTAETCNNLDDNCNGQIDENLSRSCTTTCGAGTETCSAGTWGPCSATRPRSCMSYSTCKQVQQCVSACPGAPAESCDLKDDNCNGKCDDGAGCRAGVYRSRITSTGEHFYTTSASEAACCGYTVEVANSYYLYKSPVSGLVAFYRCRLGNGMHFYTTSSNCEGAPGSIKEGTLGYISPKPVCGAVPLYRLSASNADHFYTTSSSERQAAISSGYKYEGVAGYVWKAP